MGTPFIKKNKAVFLTILFVVGALLLVIQPPDPRISIDNKIRGATDPHPELLIKRYDSCEKFRHVYDSLEKLSAWKTNLYSPFINTQLLWFGVTKINECDSCNEIQVTEKNKKQFRNKYFFVLKDYTLGNNTFFKIDKGKYFVRNFKWEKSGQGIKGTPTDVESKVRFAHTNEYPRRETYLLVPVSPSLYNFLYVAFKILQILVAMFLLWAVIILPAQTLYNIALGRVFTKQNIGNIRYAGWTIIIVSVLPIFFNWIFLLAMGNAIPKGLYFPTLLYLNDNKGFLITGVAFLLLGEAFKNGYKLQLEQDLTI